MTTQHRHKPASAFHTPPQALHMISASLILFLIVGIFTGRNISVTDRYVSGLMAERGRAIIKVFEGSLRNELRTRSGLRVQTFLEDLASSEDILFIALALSNGEIVAHSDPSRVGRQLVVDGREATPEIMRGFLDHENDEQDGGRSVMRMENTLSFVVHRSLYNPQPNPAVVSLPQPDAPDLPPALERFAPPPPPRLTLVLPLQIFVGLDSLPLRKMQEQNMRSALFSGILVLLAGLAVTLALRYFEHGTESRRRMRVAETLAQNMVDEVRRLEKEMRHREKQAAVGDLAAGVAHELRNPLSSIKGYATYFGTRFPQGSEDREAAQIMVQEVDRLNRVITDLIGVSKPTDINPVMTDMGRLVDGIIRLIGQDAGQRMVSLRREGESPTAWVDPDRLRQAVLNICLNAVEAMSDGGEVVLSLETREGHVHLAIRDNGPGIPPEVLSRVFDPYFTTKAQGTGLGMVMVLKIIEAHGGAVHIESTPGRGATVHIVLPLTPSGPGPHNDSAGDNPCPNL